MTVTAWDSAATTTVEDNRPETLACRLRAHLQAWESGTWRRCAPTPPASAVTSGFLKTRSLLKHLFVSERGMCWMLQVYVVRQYRANTKASSHNE